MARRGLLKLMLRLPALRGQLQVLCASDASVLGLCGAFDDASTTLERLRKNRSDQDADAILEYETICFEIETDIIGICIGKQTGGK